MVLQGTMKPSQHEVSVPLYGISHRVRMTKNCELIAFIDRWSVWRFVAFPMFGKPIDSDVLEIWGFNDDEGDVCFVWPG